MKWLLRILVGLVGLVVLMALVGWLLPKDHVATRLARYRQSPEALWKAITDIETMTSWREGLNSVKRLPDRNGMPAWVENVSGAGDIPLEVISSQPPQRLVVRIADPSLPFGGTWTYVISPTAEGSTLRITENGEIRNPLFRFLSRFDQSGTIRTYLNSLAKKFGEPPRIEETGSFERLVLEECQTYEQMDEAEIRLIAELETTDPKVGYNVSKGGDAPMRGRKHRADSIELMRDAKLNMSDETRELNDQNFARAIPRKQRERILRGRITGGEDVVALRCFVGLTQQQFAKAPGISVHTLRNWEQGRRRPEGPALALLRVAAWHPRVLRENLAVPA